MRRSIQVAAVLAASAAIWAVAADGRAERLSPGPTYHGMCDASGGVAIDEDRFVVANDEDNVLRLFHRTRPDRPVAEFDLGPHLAVDPNEPESDMEAACMLDGRIFWITSHGRNKKDKVRESRCRLFATSITGSGDNATIQGVGRVYSQLLDDLLSDSRLARYRLAQASEKAPKKKGALNIEGLAASPSGQLLVAFRNPLPGGKALVVPIENPKEVVDGGARARLSAPIELDLSVGGTPLAVRSIEHDPSAERYWIVAGSYEAGGPFALFHWSGGAAAPVQVKGPDFGDLNPEAVFVYPGKIKRVQLLSDDGTKQVGGKECKKVGDPARRSFRSGFIE